MNVESTGTDSENDWGPRRSRTVTWYDPGPIAARVRQLAGIDVYKAAIDGAIPTPPLERMLQFQYVAVEPGCVVVSAAPDETAHNGFGTVHGGWLCALLDTVSGSALQSALPIGRGCSSIEIKVNYLRPVHNGAGTLTATGKVVRSGSRVGFVEGVIADSAGKPVATSASSLLIFDV